ncbi:MAG: hypothetical protein LBQ43_02130 [Holosporales bacterium]|jgi:hypothetical protein|nr:hypothetical protein [Holosporales bacterium]
MKNFCKALLVAAVSFVASEQVSSGEQWSLREVAECFFGGVKPDNKSADSMMELLQASLKELHQGNVRAAHLNAIEGLVYLALAPNDFSGEVGYSFSNWKDWVSLIDIIQCGGVGEAIATYSDDLSYTGQIDDIYFNAMEGITRLDLLPLVKFQEEGYLPPDYL